MEGQTGEERSMVNSKVTYSKIAITPARNENPYCQGFGVFFPCIIALTSNFKTRRRRRTEIFVHIYQIEPYM
jgi:hypothetical protein